MKNHRERCSSDIETHWNAQTPTKDKLGSTLQVFANTLPTGETSGKFNGNWVDVRDAAMAHVLALKTEAAGGQRIIAANGAYTGCA